jgi:dipeptidyl aminopeptidase/acylaminoacyl peptidase
LFALALGAALTAGGGQSAAARTLTSGDIARIVNLEQPALSPDGRRVAAIAIRADPVRAVYTNELFSVDVASGRITTLLRGRDVSTPRWEGDGRTLDYLAGAPDGSVQLFARDPRGRERALTHAAGDVLDYAWRPGHAEFAYAASDPPANAAALRAHHDWFWAGDNAYTATTLAMPVHLWLARPGAAPRRLTSGSWTVAPTDRGGIFTSQFAWSADGARLLLTKVENVFDGDNERSTLQRLDPATGRIEKLTAHVAYELSPQPAPLGAAYAYWYPRDGDYLSENELHLVTPAGDRDLTRELDRNTGGSLWLPDGRGLLTCGDDGVRSRLWRVPLRGAIVPVDLGELDVVCDSYSSSTFDAGIALSVAHDGALAFLATAPQRARELYYLAPLASAPRRLTRFNAFVESLALAKPRAFAWDGPLGRAGGVLTMPPHVEGRGRVPLVVLIHGGPGLASLATFVWEDWPLPQLLAARGYAVFQPNYRGGDDSGNAYMHAIFGDTVEGPAADILSGLAAVESLPQIDGSRVAVSGWSYGGLLTSWLTVRDHRWCAAVSGAAVNDESEEYALSVSNVQNRYYFGTSPFTAAGRALYRAQSPSEFYDRITTPTLIWSTTGDTTVPITMSYSLFHALRERGVPVRFAVFPGKTHGPSNPVQTADLTGLWGDFLDAHCSAHGASETREKR